MFVYKVLSHPWVYAADLGRLVHDHVELQQVTSGVAGRAHRQQQYSHSGSSTPRTAVEFEYGGMASATAQHQGVQADLSAVQTSLVYDAEILAAAYLLEVRACRPTTYLMIL